MVRNNLVAGVTRYWWLPLLTGLVCLGFGIWTILSPSQSLPVISMAFAIGLLAVGVFDCAWGIATVKMNPGWGWDLAMGIIDIIAGVWMLTLSPAQMSLAFLYIVGIWIVFAAFNGIGQIFAVSIYNPAATVLATLLLVVAVFFSIWLLSNPIGLGLTAWIWVGIALVCYGVFKISLAFKIRQYRNRL